MPKKSRKKQASTPEYDSTREQNVLLDEMNQKITAVAEGHSLLGRKIDKIDFELNKVKSELDTVATVVMENSRGIKRIEQKLDTVTTDHEERIKKLELVK